MALSNVNFTLGTGGLGRAAAGEDYISAMLFYTNSLPAGFSSSARVKQIFSVADAETLGIVANYSDATAATATYLITNKGATGDVVKMDVTENGGKIVNLCTYTTVTGDSTVDALGASLAAAINANTTVHGYTASYNAANDTLTITAPKRLGIFLNTGTPLAVTITGTVAGTLTNFSGGVASKFAVYHYHIAEFFRICPTGTLYIGMYAVPSPYTFTEITNMVSYSNGKIRQIGIYKDSAAFSAADMTLIHNVCNDNSTAHKELMAIYAADLSGTSDISTITDLRTYNNYLAMPCIGQDGGALGNYLYQTYGKSITVMGAQLGSLAKNKVSTSIAWVDTNNISDGYECDVLAFANGVLFSNSSVTDSLLTTLQNYRYNFLRKFVGVAGSFFNENSMACAQTSDYAYASDVRTMQKATRSLYTSLVSSLNGPILLNADGTISDIAIGHYKSKSEGALLDMVRNQELSGFSVSINSTQNILQTGTLNINISLLQIATGRNINVNIGYRVKV